MKSTYSLSQSRCFSVLVVFFFFSTLKGYSQFVNPTFNEASSYWLNLMSGDTATSESSQKAAYERWYQYWAPAVSHHGNLSAITKATLDYFSNSPTCDEDYTWKELGPINQPTDHTSYTNEKRGLGTGPVHFISFDPNDQRRMFTGSGSSGLFFSTDAGETWTSGTTDYLNKVSVSHCAVSHSNNQTWFIATGEGDGYFSPGQNSSFGVLRTTDGGNTWETIGKHADFDASYWTGSYYEYAWDWQIKKLLVDPSDANIIYAATSLGLYKTTNALTSTPSNVTWSKIYPSSSWQAVYDVEFKVGNTSTMYLSSYGTSSCTLAVSTNSGASWSTMSGTTFTGSYRRAALVTTKANSNYLYAYLTNNGTGALYRYDGTSWTALNTSLSTDLGRSNAIAVSPSSTNNVIHGNIRLYKSTNGGSSFSAIYPTSTSNEYHDDIQEIAFDSLGSYIYLATHGGIFKSTNSNFDAFNNKNTGLATSEVIGMEVSQAKPEHVLMGLYHDGTVISGTVYSDQWNPTWQRVIGGDGEKPAIDVSGNPLIATSQYGWRMKSTDFNSSWSSENNLISHWGTSPTISTGYSTTTFMAGRNGSSTKYDVFRQTSSSSTWYSISDFSSSPYNFTSYLALKIWNSPNNSNILYAHVYEGGTTHRLFKTTDANNSTPGNIKSTWTEITLPTNRWIGEMAIDENNADNFWVVFEGVESPSVSSPYSNKVYHYNSSTSTWTDWTFNLPNADVKSIVRDKSVDGGIYIGTNLGVFYTNNTLKNNSSTAWVKHGCDLPNVLVSSVRVNYCTGKLYAGTMGRGLWETSLRPRSMDLSATATWSSPVTLYSDLHVKSGQTLTVNSTVNIPRDCKIVVERGATLIVGAGGVLQNGCEQMWKGVEVWGTYNQSQTDLTAHGVVKVIDGGIIKDAHDAITTAKVDNDGNIDWNYTGGIIQCGGTTTTNTAIFRDNRRALQLLSYHDGTNNNVGYLKRTTIEITGTLNDPTVLPIEQITMYDVKGFQINTNSVISCTTSVAIANRPKGIYTIDASLVISNTTFSNLSYGAYITSTTAGHNLYISNSTFDNNQRGIYCLGTNGDVIQTNSFPVIPNKTTLEETYGVYMDGARNFSITGCSFNTNTGNPAYDYNYGIIVDNCGSYSNSINNNTFKNLEVGVQTHDNNGSGASGLKINCSTFQTHEYAWHINPLSTSGSIANQGACGSGTSVKQAINTFSDACSPTADNHIQSTITFTYQRYSGTQTVCASSAVSLPGQCGLRACSSCVSCGGGGGNGANSSSEGSDSLEVFRMSNTESSKKFDTLKELINQGKSLSAVKILKNQEDLESKSMLLSLLISEGDFKSGNKVLETLSNESEDEELTKRYFQILLKNKQNNVKVKHISEEDLNGLEEIAGTNSLVSSNARAIVKAIKGTVYYPEVIEINRRYQRPSKDDNQLVRGLMSIAPNPFTGITELSFKYNEAYSIAVVKIYDTMGKQVGIYPIKDLSTSTHLNLMDYQSGVYYCQLIIDGLPKEIQKIMLSK